jgi:hypothetical protein
MVTCFSLEIGTDRNRSTKATAFGMSRYRPERTMMMRPVVSNRMASGGSRLLRQHV